MIVAKNNAYVHLENITISGLSTKELYDYGIDIQSPTIGLRKATSKSILLGSGLSFVEGNHPPEGFSCQNKNPSTYYRHRQYCHRFSQSSCAQDSQCSPSSVCIKGSCRPVQCDSNMITLSNIDISGCTLADYRSKDGKGRLYNDDGIAMTSVNAILKKSSFENFEGCDSMIDIGHRGPCQKSFPIQEKRILVQENQFQDGKIKTTGSADGIHQVLFKNNLFINTRLSDYHRYWQAFYIENHWHIKKTSLQRYVWGEHASVGSESWQKPYYGSLHFQGNSIFSEKDRLLLIEAKRFLPKKIVLSQNQYWGKEFIWLRTRGETRHFLSKEEAQKSLFDETFSPNKDDWIWQQKPIKIHQFTEFQKKLEADAQWFQEGLCSTCSKD